MWCLPQHFALISINAISGTSGSASLRFAVVVTHWLGPIAHHPSLIMPQTDTDRAIDNCQ
jgi:hypothetical protein